MKLKYLGHIDALRAIAVLFVVLYHLDVGLFEGGFVGVDVFFVISGFLITRIITHEYFESGKVDFIKFYTRRIRRLMPSLFLILLLTFILTFLAFSPSDFINAMKSMFMSSIALSNFHFLSESSYFDTASDFKPLLHTWSLALEEQFYLFYPLTLFLLLKFLRKKSSVIIGLVVILLSSFFLTVYTTSHGIPDSISRFFLPDENILTGVASMHFFLLPFRMFEFLIGAIAVLLPQFRWNNHFTRLGLNILGLSILFYFAMMVDKTTENLSIMNIVLSLGTAVLLVVPPAKYLSFIFNNKVLMYVGKISYTLYLVHWVLIVVYRYIFGGDLSILGQVSLGLISIALSSAIYKYYESPLRYRRSKFSVKSNVSLIQILGICVLLVYTVKSNVVYADGWMWRLGMKKVELIKKIGVPKNFHLNNWGGAGYKHGMVGESLSDSVSPDMIWLGDSHSAHYLFGLDKIMVSENKKHIYMSDWYSSLKLPDIIIVGRGDEYAQKCKLQFESNLKLVKEYSTAIVVLSHYWDLEINGSEVFNYNSNRYEKLNTDSTGYRIVAEKILKFQRSAGSDRKFIIIGSSPTTNSNELNYIEKLLKPMFVSNLSPTYSTFQQNHQEMNDFFERYFKDIPNIYFLNPAPAFCDEGECLKQLNDNIYFSDYSHYSLDGSLIAVKYLEDEFIKILNDNG